MREDDRVRGTEIVSDELSGKTTSKGLSIQEYLGIGKMKDVLVVGSVSIDTVVQGDLACIKMGGVAVYGAVTFRRFGLQTTVVTNIGREVDLFLKLFQQHGIKIQYGPSGSTTTCTDYVAGNERLSEFAAFARPISVEQVLDALPGKEHVHLGPLHPLDIDSAVLEVLSEGWVPVSLDIQGYLRSPRCGSTAAFVSEQLSTVLNLASVVKAGNTELQTINDATGMDVHELIRVHNINEFVVTAGNLGGTVVLASGEEVRYQAMPAPSGGDPTGAGDVFFAAYIASRLNQKLDVADSCRHAAEVAAMQVSGQYIRGEQLAV